MSKSDFGIKMNFLLPIQSEIFRSTFQYGPRSINVYKFIHGIYMMYLLVGVGSTDGNFFSDK